MNTENKHYFYKRDLSKLLMAQKILSFDRDEVVIDRIMNLLTEGKSVEKIKGILSTTEIVKYVGDISDNQAEGSKFEKVIKICHIAGRTGL